VVGCARSCMCMLFRDKSVCVQWTNNFNDMPSGMVTLFVLLVVSAKNCLVDLSADCWSFAYSWLCYFGNLDTSGKQLVCKAFTKQTHAPSIRVLGVDMHFLQAFCTHVQANHCGRVLCSVKPLVTVVLFCVLQHWGTHMFKPRRGFSAGAF
jgi:hypothetical protein